MSYSLLYIKSYAFRFIQSLTLNFIQMVFYPHNIRTERNLHEIGDTTKCIL